MPADIESVAVMFDRPGQPTDEAGVLLQDSEPDGVTRQLVGRRQAGRSSSEDDHVLARPPRARFLHGSHADATVMAAELCRAWPNSQGAAANRINVPTSKRFAPAISNGLLVCAARAKSVPYGGPIGRWGIATRQTSAIPRSASFPPPLTAPISLPLRGRVRVGAFATSTHTSGSRITR